MRLKQKIVYAAYWKQRTERDDDDDRVYRRRTVTECIGGFCIYTFCPSALRRSGSQSRWTDKSSSMTDVLSKWLCSCSDFRELCLGLIVLIMFLIVDISVRNSSNTTMHQKTAKSGLSASEALRYDTI